MESDSGDAQRVTPNTSVRKPFNGFTSFEVVFDLTP